MVTCCESCRSHGTSFTDFSHNGLNKNPMRELEIDLKRNLAHHTDFTFPIYGFHGQERFAKEYGYHGVVDSPGIAHVVNTKTGESIATKMFKNIIGSWPPVALAFLLTYIAGVAIWVVVSSIN